MTEMLETTQNDLILPNCCSKLRIYLNVVSVILQPNKSQ